MTGFLQMNKLPFLLLGLIAAILAIATIVEKQYGTQTAIDQIYTSWWMCALWAAMAVGGLIRCLQVRLWKQPLLFLFHVSFAIILVGAFITHLTSERGYIHLRTQETTNLFVLPDRSAKPLPFYLCLDSFLIDVDAQTETPRDYISRVMIHGKDGDEHLAISMNKPARKAGFRIYQTSYDDDLRGSIFTVMYDPWGIGVTYLGYALLALSMALLLAKRSWGVRKGLNYKTFMPVLAGVVFASYMVIPLFAQPLMPVLRSPMLVIHVGVIMVSYCLLVVSFFNPALLRVAVFTLAAGIFLGAIWANLSWGTYWSWDPKEAWALVTLIVYAIPLHGNSLPWFRDKRHYQCYSAVAFLCLLMTYFGVNLLLGGMHAYL